MPKLIGTANTMAIADVTSVPYTEMPAPKISSDGLQVELARKPAPNFAKTGDDS